jgi:hypothetical protein
MFKISDKKHLPKKAVVIPIEMTVV